MATLTFNAIWPQSFNQLTACPSAHLPATMANRGYDVVVDVDQEVLLAPKPSSSKMRKAHKPRAT
jgi:hypothetical protein